MLQIAGNNKFCQINEDISKKNSKNEPIIYPSYTSSFSATSLLSYSICFDHAVVISKKGIIQGVGDNSNHQIWDSLPKEVLKKWTQFEIQDIYGKSYNPLSAVCGYDNTLYMAQKQDDDSVHLFYIRSGKNYGIPLLLNTKNRKPIAIYGGLTTAAAIDSNGSILFINDMVFKDIDNEPQIGSLPNDEIAISLACCDECVFALSLSGLVYKSERNSNGLIFMEVFELKKFKIINISGISGQCLAVSDEGKVYGQGKANVIGIKSKQETIDQFTVIKELSSYKIKAAYAGTMHSLYQAISGKIISCGNKDTGALLIEGPLNDEYTPTPVETIIKSNAKFCIAGVGVSAVFVNCEIPKNCPNQPTQKVENTLDKDAGDKEGENDQNSEKSKCCILI